MTIQHHTSDFCVSRIIMSGRDLWFVNRFKNGKVLGAAGVAGFYYKSEQDAVDYMNKRQKLADEFMGESK